MKHAFLIFSIFLLLGCTSTPTQNINNRLDDSIQEGSKYLASRISINSKVAVVAIESPTEKLSSYVADSISMHLLSTDTFTVIENFDRNLIFQEQQYQLSGAVSDETAVSIGKELGSQFIIIGSILPLGSTYSFRLKILNVETAQVLGTRIYQINPDEKLIALATNPIIPIAEQKDEPVNSQPQTIINNNVNNITNNNETTIHGDVFINAPNGLFGY